VVAHLKTRRRRVDLVDASGTKVAEVVDDEVSVLEDGRIVNRFRELEVELSEDAPVELADSATGDWVAKAPMPTARSAGVAVVLDGKIYVAGGRVPQGQDFAVYDPTADRWEVLPDLPTQRNHITGAAIDGRIHVVGGRQGNGLSPLMTTAHEVFDPQTRTWTTRAPMLRARSGMNGVMARGCFHVWGGEGPAGMFPDHDYYDPRTDQWTRLIDMPVPVHGVYGSAFVGGLIWVAGGGTDIGGNHGSTHNQVYQPAESCE
jgi:N-acetylneuraminic acid mutarotase